MSSSGKNNIPKKSVDEIIAYWDRRIRKSKDSLESVLWEDLPIWNRYVDEIQRYYLKRVFSMIKPSDVVLDVGCGIGRFTFRLSKICKEVVGIDSSSEAIKICKKKAEDYCFSNTKFEVMDVRRLNFDDETFDWVLSVTTLQHITNERDLITALREILRVAKKEGKIVLLECTSDKRKDQFVISLPRKKWFEMIENLGGKIEYWHGLDIPSLRRIIFHGLALTKRIRTQKLRKLIEYGLIYSLKPLEYTIPKISKNQSLYTVIVVRKNNGSERTGKEQLLY